MTETLASKKVVLTNGSSRALSTIALAGQLAWAAASGANVPQTPLSISRRLQTFIVQDQAAIEIESVFADLSNRNGISSFPNGLHIELPQPNGHSNYTHISDEGIEIDFWHPVPPKHIRVLEAKIIYTGRTQPLDPPDLLSDNA